MDAKKVRECLKELENAGNADRMVEVLEDLQAHFKPTEQLLRETKIGVAVNKLRSHSDSRVSSLVKKLVGSWREQVQLQKAKQKAKQKVASASPASAGSASAGASAGTGAGASTTTDSTESSADAAKSVDVNKKRDWKTDGVDTKVYGDQVRNSCIQVTYNALAIGSALPGSRILDAAKGIEAAVFTAERSTSPAYRNKMRSLYMYLKDPKNPTLRSQVLLGKISGERLRTMKPQEMANDELKKQMEELEKQNLFNAQSAQEQRATTDRFTCGKCKNKKVSYYQLQTRSADEPLTTFCTCEVCGHRWKFS